MVVLQHKFQDVAAPHMETVRRTVHKLGQTESLLDRNRDRKNGTSSAQ